MDPWRDPRLRNGPLLSGHGGFGLSAVCTACVMGQTGGGLHCQTPQQAGKAERSTSENTIETGIAKEEILYIILRCASAVRVFFVALVSLHCQQTLPDTPLGWYVHERPFPTRRSFGNSSSKRGDHETPVDAACHQFVSRASFRCQVSSPRGAIPTHRTYPRRISLMSYGRC